MSGSIGSGSVPVIPFVVAEGGFVDGEFAPGDRANPAGGRVGVGHDLQNVCQKLRSFRQGPLSTTGMRPPRRPAS
jgi:hypothetical protein